MNFFKVYPYSVLSHLLREFCMKKMNNIHTSKVKSHVLLFPTSERYDFIFDPYVNCAANKCFFLYKHRIECK